MVTSVFKALGYYSALALFALGGLMLNAGCLLVAWLPRTAPIERFFQRIIHRHFVLLVWLIRHLGVVYVRYEGAPALLRQRCVVIANHPGLLDAPLLLAQLPEAVCIFKRAIRRNPLLGAAARKAGYIANDGGVDLVRLAAEQVAGGATLIIFPEGTRTPPGARLGEVRAGFGLIARRAGAPVQLVRIDYDAPILAKAQAWWRLPRLPVNIVVQVGPLLDASAAPATLAAAVEAWWQRPVDVSGPSPWQRTALPAGSTVPS